MAEKYVKTLRIGKDEASVIEHYLRDEPTSRADCFGEEETVRNTVRFDNGVEMDIKCCGVQFLEGQSNTAWTEAVLFANGSEVCCTEPAGEYVGEWECEYNGDAYVVVVEVE